MVIILATMTSALNTGLKKLVEKTHSFSSKMRNVSKKNDHANICHPHGEGNILEITDTSIQVVSSMFVRFIFSRVDRCVLTKSERPTFLLLVFATPGKKTYYDDPPFMAERHMFTYHSPAGLPNFLFEVDARLTDNEVLYPKYCGLIDHHVSH